MIIHNDFFQQSITVSVDKQQEIPSFCSKPLHKHKDACSLTHFLYICISSYNVFDIQTILTLERLSMLLELLSILAWYFLCL